MLRRPNDPPTPKRSFVVPPKLEPSISHHLQTTLDCHFTKWRHTDALQQNLPLHPASCTEWCDRHTFDAADTADTLRQASCSGATEMSSMQETPYYNGPATRCVDFIRLHCHQLTFAARPRWPMPWENSRMLYVVLPHA